MNSISTRQPTSPPRKVQFGDLYKLCKLIKLACICLFYTILFLSIMLDVKSRAQDWRLDWWRYCLVLISCLGHIFETYPYSLMD